MKQYQHDKMVKPEQELKIRLDKWLWAARFYKTRALATEAIKGGKIHVNNSRIKPSHHIQVGESIRIRKHHEEKTILIDVLSDKRGPATIAQTLYTESSESIEKREEFSRQKRDMYLLNPTTDKRPNKKQRRHIIKFKQEKNFGD
jgi:ribosome-associated heat shock protein Hsp15